MTLRWLESRTMALGFLCVVLSFVLDFRGGTTFAVVAPAYLGVLGARQWRKKGEQLGS